MDILFTSLNKNTILLPINLLFWINVCTYILHVFEESVIPEVFVEKMKRLYFPSYNWNKFFAFNTFLLTLNISAVILFESIQGAWIIFPLSLMFERVFNGFWHLFETIINKKYSSGLLTSVIVWIAMYLLIRYSFIKGEILSFYFFTSLIIGLVIKLLMMVPTVLGMYKKK